VFQILQRGSDDQRTSSRPNYVWSGGGEHHIFAKRDGSRRAAREDPPLLPEGKSVAPLLPSSVRVWLPCVPYKKAGSTGSASFASSNIEPFGMRHDPSWQRDHTADILFLENKEGTTWTWHRHPTHLI